MSSKHSDQAENLRRKNRDYRDPKEKDSASLPPRSETHSKEAEKVKWNIRFPAARFLLVIFLIMVAAAVLTPVWLDL
ncbi:hypothetical protein [Salibacterium halotolerans]|uniref:Uncharacterized protein n=1 Tax=Salibacterium halotolerans TaxID=1884432 RepID=A0A1I5Q325_9BACI|nr:hypothetical protein [Salibacterium halotolerans]SFP40371.1 hypothetical protein SAMN05518683_1055 [Salibacterium halotolerans]